MSVRRGEGGPAIALCKWVKNPDVKNAHCCLSSQNPCTCMSSRAPSSVLDVLPSVSPVDFHRPQSVFAPSDLWHDCLSDGNPLHGQLSACSVENTELQTQWYGRCGGVQPYRRQRAPWNEPLGRVKLFSSMGRATNQLEALLSLPRSIALCSLVGSESLLGKSPSPLSLVVYWSVDVSKKDPLLLEDGCSKWGSNHTEFLWWMAAHLVGFIIPRPRQAGNSRRFLSKTLNPVRLVEQGESCTW